MAKEYRYVGNATPLFATWKQDLQASIVVFLVALPLCLGIALASGAPLISGLIAGIIGGIVIGVFSRSPLSVSGPAAGLAIIVLNAIESLPTYEAFLLAVAIGGFIQMILGLIRAGVIGDFIPVSVIKGMLAAIGILIAIKQIPYTLGYKTLDLSSLDSIVSSIQPGAMLVALPSLAFLFIWDKIKPKEGVLQYVPGPLVVVVYGVIAAIFFEHSLPSWTISEAHFVNVPLSEGLTGFIDLIRTPDFSFITNQDVWIVGVTLALVASVETLLSIQAVDKLDPQRRVTPSNRELLAQGAGNFISGLIGGLPITSVIVRSSANVSAGAQNRLSTIFHGIFLFLAVVFFAKYINYIPLSALAAVLIAIGFKLAHPQIFIEKWRMGSPNLIPFIVTIGAILITDLLIGVVIGLVVGLAFVIYQNFQTPVSFTQDGNKYTLRCNKDIHFIHKHEVRKYIRLIPHKSSVTIDISQITFMDMDNVEVINDFLTNASYRGIKVRLKKGRANSVAKLLIMPEQKAA